MLTMIFAAALAAAAPAAPAGQPAQPAAAQQMHMGQMPGMDMSKMDHSKMDHSKMSDGGCCKKGADGKMECSMPKEAKGTASGHQGHSGQ